MTALHPVPGSGDAVEVRLTGTAVYLPERWRSARELAADSGIGEDVIVTKFGLRGRYAAADGEQVSDMAAKAGRRVLAETGTAPGDIDAVVYFGSTWKDHPVWQAAPRVAYLLGCAGTFALELDYTSCGAPVALRVAKDLMVAEPELRTVLLVAASKESALVDPRNRASRFMLDFGDGAVAALLRRAEPGTAAPAGATILGSHALTDGSFSLQVKVPAGGSAEPASAASVAAGRHRLDVADPRAMKAGLDEVSLPNFVAAAQLAAKRSGAALSDIGYLCGIHMKRSMHESIITALGLPPDRAAYLDDTGHLSGADPLIGYDRARRAGLLPPTTLCLLLAAGTGYTWAATCLRTA